MANDGGVQAKVDSAKAALSGAADSNVSPSQSPFAPPKTTVTDSPKTQYGHARAARNTTGDELAEKKKNVEEYAAASKQ